LATYDPRTTAINLTMSGVDRRRRTGPANAIPLYFPSTQSLPHEKPAQTSSSKDKLFIELSNIPTATGSSFIQSGSNILLASVYGPRPSFKKTFNTKATVKITFHSSPFISTRQAMKSYNSSKVSEKAFVDPEYKIIDSVVLSTLETACANLILLENYPKSNIEIFINLINTDNKTKFIDLLPLIHNAVNLALVDSGMAIRNFPTAAVSQDKVFVNSIHSSTYTQDEEADLQNEELLAFYIPKTELSNQLQLEKSLNESISTARSLRAELSQFCTEKL
jgi:exosome complex component MTR3